MNLREFLTYITITSALLFGALAAGLAVWYASPTNATGPVELGPLETFPEADRPYKVVVTDERSNRTFWVVHVEGEISVFDARNPGRVERPNFWRCIISWNTPTQRFEDPCSGDKYALTGEPWEPTENDPFRWDNYSDRGLDQVPHQLIDGAIFVDPADAIKTSQPFTLAICCV